MNNIWPALLGEEGGQALLGEEGGQLFVFWKKFGKIKYTL